jgi:hypothetical protein
MRLQVGFVAFLSVLMAGCADGIAGTGEPDRGQPVTLSAPIPELGRWEAQMRSGGRAVCALLQRREASFDERLAATYYDATAVFYQIADYTGEAEWSGCAAAARRVYRDEYVRPNEGRIPGYWNFTRGLTEDYLRTGDEASREAVLALARNGAFARDSTGVAETLSPDQSRETAYVILAYLNAEEIGGEDRARLATVVDHAFGHLESWFVSGAASYVRPFMVALTAEALIRFHERRGDVRTVPALVRAADAMWERMWLPDAQAFMYTDRVVPSGGREPSPDLNLLIAPLYGWLYRMTGEPRFAERGDAIFAGGIRGANISNPKQFNQNYRWSGRYVEWRRG